MRKQLLLLLLLLISLTVRSQLRVQRAMFSQYQFNALAVNPAYSAADEQGRVTAISRHQWVGFDGAPQTQTIGCYFPLPNGKTSVGALFIHDKLGVENEQAIFLSLAQKVQLTANGYLATGFTTSIGYYLGDYGSLQDPASPDPVFVNQNSWRSSVGLGLMYYDEHLEIGFSSPYLVKFNVGPSNSSTSLKALRSDYYMMGSYRIPVNDFLRLKPAFMLKYTKGVPMQLDVNLNAYFEEKGLWMGAGYRSGTAIMAMFQVRLNDRMQLGYSHDFMTKISAPHQLGTHEIMLNYRFSLKKDSYKANEFRD